MGPSRLPAAQYVKLAFHSSLLGQGALALGQQLQNILANKPLSADDLNATGSVSL